MPWQTQEFWAGLWEAWLVIQSGKGAEGLVWRGGTALSCVPRALCVSPKHLWALCHPHPHLQSKHSPALPAALGPHCPHCHLPQGAWDGTGTSHTPPAPTSCPAGGRKEGRKEIPARPAPSRLGQSCSQSRTGFSSPRESPGLCWFSAGPC